jgi:hypothetical protein
LLPVERKRGPTRLSSARGPVLGRPAVLVGPAPGRTTIPQVPALVGPVRHRSVRWHPPRAAKYRRRRARQPRLAPRLLRSRGVERRRKPSASLGAREPSTSASLGGPLRHPRRLASSSALPPSLLGRCARTVASPIAARLYVLLSDNYGSRLHHWLPPPRCPCYGAVFVASTEPRSVTEAS